MQLVQYALLSCIALTLTIPAQAAPRRHSTRTKSHKTLASHHAAKPKFQTQRAMDDDRAAQIQSALIRTGYLSGSPSGHWDTASEAAMQKLQGDNGWQTKLVPDSRALIKLGLGPNATPADVPAPLTSRVPSFGPTVTAPAIIAQARP